MWEIEDIPDFERLPLADQLWVIALAVEENAGPAEYSRALRLVAERLEEIGWWLSNGPAPPEGERSNRVS